MKASEITWHADGKGMWVDMLVDRKEMDAFMASIEAGKTYEVTIKPYRQKRTLTANAYFHALCGEIAKAIGSSLEAVKRHMVLDYGVPDTIDGEYITAVLPSDVDPYRYIEYPLPVGTMFLDCRYMTEYALFKRTSDMDTKEFGALLDGTVYEAKELGIETMDEIQIRDLMEEYEKQKHNQ